LHALQAPCCIIHGAVACFFGLFSRVDGAAYHYCIAGIARLLHGLWSENIKKYFTLVVCLIVIVIVILFLS
jgi:hypothetical protein